MRILLLGVGNIIFGDEGIGVHFCHYMKKNYLFESPVHTIDFIDGGTLASRLIPLIIRYDYAIICDCIEVKDEEPGVVFFFNFDDIPNSISWQGSAHEVEMLQTLRMIDMAGDRPPTKIIGIIPKRVSSTTFILSNAVIQGAKMMEDTLISHLESLGFSTKKIDTLSLEEIANTSFKNTNL